ncbi:diguanylate cyclase domain-containing protein [Actinoplanes sp. CA-015351]|uniref:diguanylate cyclase domain-containing protein n=1 Tax=Actinoplanes sp. CA-015351 TaxID=3239897 RepID=UPI003D95A554
MRLVGEYHTSSGAPDAEIPVTQFPPLELFSAADGRAGDVVMVAPVRTRARDWGMLAAVGRIQSTIPPGREMMNHSGSLLGKALDYQVTLAALREQEERLRNAALRDHLTGLPNRLLLEDRLTQAGLRATRDPEYRFAVLLLDLDGFKAVNDTLGHAAGDQLLIKVAKRLTKLLRRTDTVARLGGDEFVVLVGGVSAEDGHETVRKAIQTALSEPYLIDDKPVTVGVSIGVAVSGDTSADPDRLLREADAAMYREKTARR